MLGCLHFLHISENDMVSIAAGKKATDACECISLELLSTGKCGESSRRRGAFHVDVVRHRVFP